MSRGNITDLLIACVYVWILYGEITWGLTIDNETEPFALQLHIYIYRLHYTLLLHNVFRHIRPEGAIRQITLQYKLRVNEYSQKWTHLNIALTLRHMCFMCANINNKYVSTS